MRRRQPPEPPEADGLTDAQAAALQRAASLPGWRLDGPEWAPFERKVTQLLAARWRRRVAREREHAK